MKDQDATDTTATPESAEGVAGEPVKKGSGVAATLDWGTSRAVGSILDTRNMIPYPYDSLPVDGVAEAMDALGLVPDPEEDIGLTIEAYTVGEAQNRAEVWRKIFKAPPLEFNKLKQTKERSSDLTMMNGQVEFADENAGNNERLRGGKRYFGADETKKLGSTQKTIFELFPEIFTRFKELAEMDLKGEKDQESAEGAVGVQAVITRVLVTYPVKLPPDRRQKLLEILRDAKLATQVEMNVDEATAAAGFVLMQRFGSDSVLGAEAFKLQARCPEGFRSWENPDRWAPARQWHENLLVVDVGGGTTDCALVKVVVTDDTPVDLGECVGRFYRLQPEILASGGRLHLGGDLITLDVFRVLKKLLCLPDEATKFKDAGEQAPQRREVFDELWEAAEKIKRIGMRGQVPVDVVVKCVDKLPGTSDGDNSVTVEKGVLAKASGSAGVPSSVTVGAARISEIIETVVRRVAPLAAGIADGGLRVLNERSGQECKQAVDRVVFSGGSMLGTSLRNSLEDRLRVQFAEDGLDSAFELYFDEKYCKASTAHGGMYLKAVKITGAQKPGDVLDRLKDDGVSYFEVDPSRLRMNMAADFKFLRSHSAIDDRPIFSRGDSLQEEGGQRIARSGYSWPVSSKIEVHRFDVTTKNRGTSQGVNKGNSEQSAWCQYDDVSEDVVSELVKAGVRLWFEIDDDEQVTIIFRRPGSVKLDGDPLNPESAPGEGLVKDGKLTCDLCVDVYQPGFGIQNPKRLAAKGDSVAENPKIVNLHGAGEVRYLDESGEKPSYPVLLTINNGHGWLSVDSDGKLRTHEKRPELAEVKSLSELLKASGGAVFRKKLTSPDLYDETKDPFSGIH